MALLLQRRRDTVRFLISAILTGVGFAALYGLYALVRLDHVTITSKQVEFSPLAMMGIFLLAGEGAFLFLCARAWRARVLALAVATFPTWAMTVFSLGIVAIVNRMLTKAGPGVSLYNHHLGLMALIAFAFEAAVLGAVFRSLSRGK